MTDPLPAPLIAGDNYIALTAVFALLVTLGRHADSRKIGRYIPGVMLVIVISVLLTNLNVLPSKSPFYDQIFGLMVPMAVSMILLKANLPEIIRHTGKMLTPFLLGSAGTLLGAVIAFHFVKVPFDAAELSGIFSATYIGGSLNFVTVGQALEVAPDTYLAALTADLIGSAVFLMVLPLVPLVGWIASRYAPEAQEEAAAPETGGGQGRLGLGLDIGLSFFFAAALCLAGMAAADAFDASNMSIVFVTGFTLVFAIAAPKLTAPLRSNDEVGTLLLYLFFAAIGAEAAVPQGLIDDPGILIFALVIVFVHLAVIVLGSVWTGASLMATLVASNACILGPATAAAMAQTYGRRHLVTPGLMVGILGYAIGSFLALALAKTLAAL